VTTTIPASEQATTLMTTTSNADQSSELARLNGRKNGLEKIQTGWETALSIALLVTAVAAFLVFVFDWRVRKSSKAIQEVQDEVIRAKDAELQSSLRDKDLKIAQADERIAKLGKEAADAKLDIAKANQRASEADARAEEARLQVVKLRTPRTLSLGQQATIAEKLKGFHGIDCDIAIFNDPEVQALLPKIEYVLKEAGWNQVHWWGGDVILQREGHPVVGLVFNEGILIHMNSEKVKEFGPAAQALTDALKAEGIEAKWGTLAAPNNKPNVMHILIGKKPQ
jgi:low affinity Fe/Cu permease